jgi:hypothetical protein
MLAAEEWSVVTEGAEYFVSMFSLLIVNRGIIKFDSGSASKLRLM